MSLLRIRCPLGEPPQRCEWAFIGNDGKAQPGQGRLAELPRRADRVQLVIPAAEVVIAQTRLPAAAKRRSGSVLSYAVEEETLGQPEANEVSWLGSLGEDDLLAVWDRQGLKRWVDALASIGLNSYEVHWETFLLPWNEGEWSLAWNKSEGFVRHGEFQGAATDCGDQTTPPMSLRLLLEAAQKGAAPPASLAVFAGTPESMPDLDAWQGALGISVRAGGVWDWRSAPVDAGVSVAVERKRWRFLPGMIRRLRPAAWIAGAALAVHAVGSVASWGLLAAEQQQLRQKMTQQFRAAFPETVSVVEPALQMRRKLAEVRHAVGQSDSGDFLPMIEKAAAGLKELPPGKLRTVSFEGGRMTLELVGTDASLVKRVVSRLTQSGLSVDVGGKAGGAESGGTVVMTVSAAL